MPESDYNSYLQTIYPDTEWTVSRFYHGSVNATHRAVKVSGAAGPASLVLKHAAPYFEDEDSGETQEFSLNRQQIEATIMQYSANPCPTSDITMQWRVPLFLHRSQGKESELLHTDSDEECSLMLIEDLGNVRNLRDSITAWAELDPSTKIDEFVAKIGGRLGTSLATLHSAEMIHDIEASGLQEILSQRLTDDVNWFLAMELLPNYLASSPQAKEYFEWLAEDMKSPKYVYPSCLMHGDFNYGNILMPMDALETGNSQPIAMDWEFATSRGRGVNGDISEFLSMIHCRLISGRTEQSAISKLFRKLCHSFCAAYRDKAQLVCKMEADDLNSQLYRSALLLTGRDVLTFANDALQKDPAFDEIIKVGLWYFERAGANMEEFVREDNRKELELEDEGLVRSLFIFE